MTQQDYALNEIMAHSKFPFADWQTDDLSFLMLELFWTALFKDVLGADAVKQWHPRFDTPRDGNPILVLGNAITRRAFRVVVVTNEDNRPVYPTAKGGEDAYYYFTAFTGLVDEYDGAPPWQELGFFVELHPSILDIAKLLISTHCGEMKSVNETEQIIADYESRMEMGTP